MFTLVKELGKVAAIIVTAAVAFKALEELDYAYEGAKKAAREGAARRKSEKLLATPKS